MNELKPLASNSFVINKKVRLGTSVLFMDNGDAFEILEIHLLDDDGNLSEVSVRLSDFGDNPVDIMNELSRVFCNVSAQLSNAKP